MRTILRCKRARMSASRRGSWMPAPCLKCRCILPAARRSGSHRFWGKNFEPVLNNSVIQHEFLAIDEGHATLLHIDERDQARNWSVLIGQPAARDMQFIGENKVLIGHHHGYTEFDLAMGRDRKGG